MVPIVVGIIAAIIGILILMAAIKARRRHTSPPNTRVAMVPPPEEPMSNQPVTSAKPTLDFDECPNCKQTTAEYGADRDLNVFECSCGKIYCDRCSPGGLVTLPRCPASPYHEGMQKIGMVPAAVPASQPPKPTISLGANVRRLAGHDTGVTRLLFKLDNTRLISAGKEEFKVWDVKNGECLSTIGKLPSRGGKQVSFSTNGDRAVVVDSGYDAKLEVWDLVAEQLIDRYVDDGGTHSIEAFEKHIGLEAGGSISPDGTRIAAGCSKHDPHHIIKGIRIWQAGKPLKPVREFGWTPYGYHQSVFLPDNRTLLGTMKATLSLWDVDTGEEVLRFKGGDGKADKPALAADGKTVVTASQASLHIWDTASGSEKKTINLNDSDLSCLALSADGKLVAGGVSSKDGLASIQVWDADKGDIIHQATIHQEVVWALAFSSDSRLLASADIWGAVLISELPVA